MKKIHSKMKWLEWSQHISNYKSMGFSQMLKVRSGQIFNSLEILWLSKEPAKNEEDPIKNEGAIEWSQHLTNFPDAQGQLTPQSVVESG